MIRAIDQIIEENNKRKLSEFYKRCDLTSEEKCLMAGWFEMKRDPVSIFCESGLLEPEGDEVPILPIMVDEIH